MAAVPVGVVTGPAQADTLTSHKGCDGPNLDTDWPLNDGNACFKDYYNVDASGNITTMAHYDEWFNKDQTGQSDELTSVTNIHLSVYWGNCDAAPDPTFPKCLNEGYVHGPICGSDQPDMFTQYPFTYSESASCSVGHKHALIIINYQGNGDQWYCSTDGVCDYYPLSWQGQEESHL